MPRVSRFRLSSEQINHLSQRTISAVSSLRGRKAVELFFDDLLTTTEKIMLGKRLLIAILLEKGFSYAKISSAVKVSETTIGTISERLHRGGVGFRLALKNLEKEEKIEKMLETIFSSLSVLARPLTSKTSKGYYQLKKRH